MGDIQTTGGLFTDESRKIINANICRVFDCNEEDIEELVPVQAGMTNVVLSFKLNVLSRILSDSKPGHIQSN